MQLTIAQLTTAGVVSATDGGIFVQLDTRVRPDCLSIILFIRNTDTWVVAFSRSRLRIESRKIAAGKRRTYAQTHKRHAH